jgi:sulfur-oxidizing protein SoxY
MRRRRFMTLAGALTAAQALPALSAVAEEDPLAEPIRAFAAGTPVRAGKVVVDTPRLADNGFSVPLKISVENAMTPADYVRAIVILAPRNPRPVVATYHLTPKSGKATVSTRVRLNGTQNVLVLARLSDGSVWSGTAEVVVTESACLDES